MDNSTNLSKLLSGKEKYAILQGHSLQLLSTLPEGIVQMVVTSPPYFGLRNYGTEPQIWDDAAGICVNQHEWKTVKPRRRRSEKDVKNPTTIQNANKGANCELPPTAICVHCGAWLGELGLEPTPEMFVQHLVSIFHEVKRVLRDDGVVFVNMADTYWKEEGKDNEHPFLKGKDMCLIPQRLAIALQEDGWYVRSEIIWAKKNCMPESMEDRSTRSHEQIWMLTKRPDYFYDKYGVTTPAKEEKLQGILGEAEFGANLRTVWIMNASDGYKDGTGEHHATFPHDLPERCIRLATSDHGCCGSCYSPYRRVVEKTYPQVAAPKEEVTVNEEIPDWYGSGGSSFRGHSGYVKADGTSMVPVVKTIGWEKTCKCETNEVKPCIVMDIFNGSGTTGLIAMQTGRNYIGLELLEKYANMTVERFNGGKNLPLLEMLCSD